MYLFETLLDTFGRDKRNSKPWPEFDLQETSSLLHRLRWSAKLYARRLSRSNVKLALADKWQVLAKKLIKVRFDRVITFQNKLQAPTVLELKTRDAKARTNLETFQEEKTKLIAKAKKNRDEELADLDTEHEHQQSKISKRLETVQSALKVSETELSQAKSMAGFESGYPVSKIKRSRLGIFVIHAALYGCDALVMVWAWLLATGQNIFEAVGMVTGNIITIIVVPSLIARYAATKWNYHKVNENIWWKLQDIGVLILAVMACLVVLILFAMLRFAIFQQSDMANQSMALQVGVSLLAVVFPLIAFVTKYFSLRRHREIAVVQDKFSKVQKLQTELAELEQLQETLRLQAKADRENANANYEEKLEQLDRHEKQLQQELELAKLRLEQFETIIAAESELTENARQEANVRFHLQRLSKSGKQKMQQGTEVSNIPIFRLFILVLLAIILTGCDQENGYVGVFCDCSEPDTEVTDYFNARDLLLAAGIDTSETFTGAITIEMFPLSDASYEGKTKITLQAQSLGANPYKRKADVRSFASKLGYDLQNVCGSRQEGSQGTSIYLPLCNQLERIAHSETGEQSRTVIVASDFLENSQLANFYELVEQDFQKQTETFVRARKLPDLSGWKIHLIPIPNQQFKEQSFYALQFFQQLFEQANATVVIGL